MKGFRSLVAVMCVGIAVSAAACSSADSTQPDSSDVTTVTVMVVPTPVGNGFDFGPSDTVNVAAAVLDGRGYRINRNVDWSLQLANGQQAGDSIGSLSSTGPQTARVVFRRPALVAVVGSVAGSDGATKSGTLYLTWSR